MLGTNPFPSSLDHPCIKIHIYIETDIRHLPQQELNDLSSWLHEVSHPELLIYSTLPSPRGKSNSAEHGFKAYTFLQQTI